jgi:hypothetical protein
MTTLTIQIPADQTKYVRSALQNKAVTADTNARYAGQGLAAEDRAYYETVRDALTAVIKQIDEQLNQ